MAAYAPFGRSVLVALALYAASALPAIAQDRQPQWLDEDSLLYQRVLVRPGAEFFDAPGGTALGEQPKSFTALYVFDRRDGYLEVGPSTRADNLAWLPAEKTIDWSQTIVVTFSNSAGRARSLLFADAAALEALVSAEDLVGRVETLRSQAVSGTLPDDSVVVSIEPEDHVDLTEQFYILPILSHKSVFDPNTYEELLLLKVASVPESFAPAQAGPSRDELLAEFDVGILFVIDTTSSMGPYIEQTREAVLRIADGIAGSEVGERVGFGLIGFRDDHAEVPELEYTTRTYLKMRKGQTPDEIHAALRQVERSEASSIGFNEDVYAGVQDAIADAGWAGFDGRFIITISDAGPKVGGQSTLKERADAKLLSADARELGMAIYSVHLRTDAGVSTHAHAEREFKELSRGLASDQGHRYFPVDAGDPAVFRTKIDALVDRFVADVGRAIDGRLAEATDADETDEEKKARLDTYAMQLALLGRLRHAQAPDVFEAWLADRALENSANTAVEVRLLITKNQINTLRDVLQAIVDAGDQTRGQTDSAAFFEKVKTAIAAMARDPDRLVDAEFETLGGALGDMLAGLPYQSEIMEITPERWVELASTEQRAILDRLGRKMRAFERLHNDADRWQQLNEGAPDGEAVYAMPLTYLP